MTQDIPAALLFLLLSGFAGAVLLELLLRRAVRVGSLAAPRMHMQIVIGAPLPRVWEYASDVQRQPEWMHEMKRVEMLTPGPVRVGSRGRATVRIFGISTTDDVVITRLEPPHAFGIRHEGKFTGEGLLEFSAEGDERTLIRWMEYLRPPLFPTLGGLIQRPILRRIFQSDLESLKRILEER
ncbi:MAG: SRPBCC family protein [Candidatus Limnocylindrus sp.]